MLSGIPRSGSQVLSSILNQHPKIHSTVTSPMADLIINVNDHWTYLHQSLVNYQPIQFRNMILGLLNGAYAHIESPYIVDKNRLWPRYGKLMADIFQTKPKIICTVRNIPEVLASYILLIEANKNKISFIDQDLIDANLPVNNKNRCKILLEKYINHPYTSLRIGYNENVTDMLFCDYDQIVFDSQNTIDRICEWIGIESFKVNLEKLQPMNENDDYHGGLDGLHTVRPTLKKTSPSPELVIGHELVKFYNGMKLEFWK